MSKSGLVLVMLLLFAFSIAIYTQAGQISGINLARLSDPDEGGEVQQGGALLAFSFSL